MNIRLLEMKLGYGKFTPTSSKVHLFEEYFNGRLALEVKQDVGTVYGSELFFENEIVIGFSSLPLEMQIKAKNLFSEIEQHIRSTVTEYQSENKLT